MPRLTARPPRAGLARARRASLPQARESFLLPTSLPGMLYWFEGDQLTFQTSGGAAAVADSDPVGEWQDLSGNARHLVQASATLRPLLRTGANGLDGLPILQFDGTNDYLQLTIPGTQTLTRYLVLRKRTAVDASLRFVHGSVYTRSSDGTGWNYNASQASGNAIMGGVVTDWQLMVLRHRDPAFLEVSSKGLILSVFDPANNYFSTATTLAFGAAAGGTSPGGYDCAALLAYANFHTNSQVNGVAAYYRRRFPSLSRSNL
jgi:hypothetical protein